MPQLIGFETKPGLGEWSMVKVPDAFTLDRKLNAAGRIAIIIQGLAGRYSR